MKRFILTIALAVIPLSLGASAENLHLKNFISKMTPHEPFFGNVLVHKNGLPVIDLSLGKANLEFDIDNTQETKFLLASVSKQFTAAAIYQLEERGKLSLTDSITKYFPSSLVFEGNRAKWEKITLKDLLQHRAGLIKDLQGDFINLSKKTKLSLLIPKLLQDPRLTSQTYGEFYYSNVGFNLLARVVEIVSHFDFDMYVSFKLFRSIDMKNSGLYHRSKVIPLMATGHYKDEDGRFQKFCCQDYSNNTGSHNLYSTSKDLMKWIKEITTDHKAVPEDFLQFKGVPENELGIQYANGLFRESSSQGGLHYWHDGFSGGYATRISFFPEKDISIVILLNRVDVFTAQSHIESIHKEVLRLLSL